MLTVFPQGCKSSCIFINSLILTKGHSDVCCKQKDYMKLILQAL